MAMQGLSTIIVLSFVCASYSDSAYGYLELTGPTDPCDWLSPSHPLLSALPELPDPHRGGYLRPRTPSELDMWQGPVA